MEDRVDIIYKSILKYSKNVIVTYPTGYEDDRYFVHIGHAPKMGNPYAVLRPVEYASVSNQTGGLASNETKDS